MPSHILIVGCGAIGGLFAAALSTIAKVSAFDTDGERIFFKIDYYDSTLTVHSPDPSDPAVTKRVITIMLAAEY